MARVIPQVGHLPKTLRFTQREGERERRSGPMAPRSPKPAGRTSSRASGVESPTRSRRLTSS